MQRSNWKTIIADDYRCDIGYDIGYDIRGNCGNRFSRETVLRILRINDDRIKRAAVRVTLHKRGYSERRRLDNFFRLLEKAAIRL
jgi:hypothetical protein